MKKAQHEGDLLTEEARKAAHNLRIDFEKGGIHLHGGLHVLYLFIYLIIQTCTSIFSSAIISVLYCLNIVITIFCHREIG